MNVYFPYILVDARYQGQNIGAHIVGMLLDHYRHFFRKTLISYDDKVAFYKKQGFSVCEGNTPMEIVFNGFEKL